MKNYYNKHFSSNLMTMVIEGPSYLDNLENALVLSQILKIPNNRVSK